MFHQVDNVVYSLTTTIQQSGKIASHSIFDFVEHPSSRGGVSEKIDRLDLDRYIITYSHMPHLITRFPITYSIFALFFRSQPGPQEHFGEYTTSRARSDANHQ